MKIRNGFVSNSSSSSFVVLVPTKFDVDQYFTQETIDGCDGDFEAYLDEEDNFNYDQLRTDVRQMLTHRSLWAEENYDLYNVIHDVMKKAGLQLTSIDTGSGDGDTIAFITEAEILTKLQKFV